MSANLDQNLSSEEYVVLVDEQNNVLGTTPGQVFLARLRCCSNNSPLELKIKAEKALCNGVFAP